MSAAVKDRLESTNDSLNEFHQFVKNLRYEFTLGTSLTESYRSNYLVIHLRLVGYADSSRDLCISLRYSHTEGHGQTAALGPHRAGSPEYDSALEECHGDMPVFVDICEFVNDIEGVALVGLPVEVRLQALDQCDCRTRNSSEPLVTQVPESIIGFADGERMLFGGLATIGNNYFINEVVEGGPQILSTISYGEGNAHWDGMKRLKTHNGAIDVSVCIQHGIAGVALGVPLNFGFKKLEMVFSPR